jgi:hypothetical protein
MASLGHRKNSTACSCEKSGPHVDWNGAKGYVATTAAEGCILGVGLTKAADDEHLPGKLAGVLKPISDNRW